MVLKQTSFSSQAGLLAAAAFSRIGVVGGLLLAVVIVAATRAGNTHSGSQQIVDALAAFAPLFPPLTGVLKAGDILVVLLAAGGLCSAFILAGISSARLRDLADAVESTLSSRQHFSKSFAVEQYKNSLSRSRDRQISSAADFGYMHETADPQRLQQAQPGTQDGDSNTSLGTRLVLWQQHAWQISSQIAAAGAFLFPLVVFSHLLACALSEGQEASTHSRDSTSPGPWSARGMPPFAGAELLRQSNGKCLDTFQGWLVTALSLVFTVGMATAAVMHRLKFPEAALQPGSIIGASVRPLQALFYDAWDGFTVLLCVVVLPLAPVGIVVLLLLIGQMLMLSHAACRLSTPHIWQWYVIVTWHAVRLSLCMCATLVTMTGGGAFQSLDGVLLLCVGFTIVTCCVAPTAVYWYASKTAANPPHTLNSPREHFLWMLWHLQHPHRGNELLRNAGARGIAGGNQIDTRPSCSTVAGMRSLQQLARKEHAGSDTAVEAWQYACAVQRAIRTEVGGSFLVELHILQRLLQVSQSMDVTAMVLSRVSFVQNSLVSMQLGTNDLAKSALLASAMQHVAICLGAQAIIWQSLSRPEHVVDVDVLHEAAAELHAARLEVEGILEFMTARTHLSSPDLLHVQAFYLQHILQLPDAALQAQEAAAALERRAAFQANHGAADGDDDDVDVSISLSELRLFQEPPMRALSTGFRASTLLRCMYAGQHAHRASGRLGGNATAVTAFDFGLLLVDFPASDYTEQVGTILQVNDFAAHLLGAGGPEEVLGCNITQFLLPGLRQALLATLKSRKEDKAHLVTGWLDRPILLPLTPGDGSVSFVFVSATVAPPTVYRDEDARGSLALQCALLVRLLPVVVRDVAHASCVDTCCSNFPAWLPPGVHGTAREAVRRCTVSRQGMKRQSRYDHDQLVWNVLPVASAQRVDRHTSGSAPRQTTAAQWVPGPTARLAACTVEVASTQTQMPQCVDVLLLALGRSSSAALQFTRRGLPPQAAEHGSTASDEVDSGAEFDSDGSAGGLSAELQDTFGGAGSALVMAHGKSGERADAAPGQGHVHVADSEHALPAAAHAGNNPGNHQQADAIDTAPPMRDAKDDPDAASSSSAALRLALGAFTLQAFPINVQFKRAVAVGIAVTSLLFLYNLMPFTIRPQTLRFSQTAAYRSSLLLASRLLPTEAMQVAALKASPWVWANSSCPLLGSDRGSVRAGAGDALVATECSASDGQKVALYLAKQHAENTAVVLHELQRLDVLSFPSTPASEAPRLTQPGIYTLSALEWPAQILPNRSDSAEGVWSKYTARVGLLNTCETKLALHNSSCALFSLNAGAVKAVQNVMVSAELRLRRHWASQVQPQYIANSVIIISAGMLMAILTAVFSFTFAWRVHLTRRWLLRSLRDVRAYTALQLYMGVTQLYDSIVYHSGAAYVTDDESGGDEFAPVSAGHGLSLGSNGGSGSLPSGSAHGTPLTGPLNTLHSAAPRGRAGTANSSGNPELELMPLLSSSIGGHMHGAAMKGMHSGMGSWHGGTAGPAASPKRSSTGGPLGIGGSRPPSLFSRSMRLSSGVGGSPKRAGGAAQGGTSPTRRGTRPPRGAMAGSWRLDSRSALGADSPIGRHGRHDAARARPFASSVVSGSRRLVSHTSQSDDGGMGSMLGSPMALRTPTGKAASVLSGQGKSVASSRRQGSQLSSAILSMGTLNMAAFRSSAETSTLAVGTPHARRLQLEGDTDADTRGSSGGPAARPPTSRRLRRMRESWQFLCVVLGFMSGMGFLVVLNISTFMGVSAWSHFNIFNSEARVSLIHDTAAHVTGVTVSALGALLPVGHPSGLHSAPLQAAADVRRRLAAVRDNVRLLSHGGDVPYLEHATLAGSTNATKPVGDDSQLGMLLFHDACRTGETGVPVVTRARRSPLVIPGEMPTSLSGDSLRSRPAWVVHAAGCGVVENGVMREGLLQALSLHASLANAAADALIASGVNSTGSCPEAALPYIHQPVQALITQHGVGPVQAASCVRLGGLVARLARLDSMHLGVALQQAAGMDFVRGLDTNLRWNVWVIAYSMVLPLVNVWAILYLAVPTFQGLLQGVVADQLLLTVLPGSLRQSSAVKQRVQPVLQHIVRRNRL